MKRVTRVGKKLITPQDAIKYTSKWIKDLGLAKKAPYGILKRKEVGYLKPILVREEIRPGLEEKVDVPYYYLVPFGFKREIGACNAPLARIGIIVNAYTGDFEEIGAFRKAVRFLPESEAKYSCESYELFR